MRFMESLHLFLTCVGTMNHWDRCQNDQVEKRSPSPLPSPPGRGRIVASLSAMHGSWKASTTVPAWTNNATLTPALSHPMGEGEWLAAGLQSMVHGEPPFVLTDAFEPRTLNEKWDPHPLRRRACGG